jgi:hypothetical protein
MPIFTLSKIAESQKVKTAAARNTLAASFKTDRHEKSNFSPFYFLHVYTDRISDKQAF